MEIISMLKKNKRNNLEEFLNLSKIPYTQVEKDADAAKERIRKRRMEEKNG